MTLPYANGRRLELAAIGLGALCIAYFYLLDRLIFSTVGFSPIFRFLLTAYDFTTAWLALLVCLFAVFWNRPAPVLKFVDFLGKHPLPLATATAVALAAGCVFVYHDYPLSMDEYAAVFQAKIFASGHTFAQLPGGVTDWLVMHGFNGSFLLASPQTGRAIEQYWPGFALVLAPFEFFGAPWICNASISGLGIYLIYWITKEITSDRRSAGWAILFALASASFIANGISYYSMQAHLTANLLFAALLIRPSWPRVVGAGLVGSLALNLHNPVPHALFAVPWIASIGLQRKRQPHLLPLLLGYLPGVAIGLRWVLFRSDIGSGHHDLTAFAAVGGGVFLWPDVTSLNMRAAALIKMVVWAVPCLFLFAIYGFVRNRADSRVQLLACSALLTFVGYLLVRFDQGHGWGYRYFHSAWGVIPILAACAMRQRSPANMKLISFGGATAILSLLIMVPFQLNQIAQFISAHLAQIGSPRRPGNNIFFIHPLGGFYVADMVQFDPLLRDPDLYLVSHGAQLDAQLVDQNWPTAIKISSNRAADQWYIAEDPRIPIPGRSRQRQFVFTYVPH
ncbi:MAG TPA: hypothetical protein VHW95_07555 [Steroidobacteraceae bacterium]|nr:hypothetical protein [Steroidobacteraceae bacterium]